MDKNVYKNLVNQAFSEIQQENNNLEKVNLLVTGKSGVGKSTLINSVFGEELAKTGVGKPVTEKINLISKDGFPIRIYDTVGFEINTHGFDITNILKSFTGNEIQKLIKKVQNSKTEEDDVHVVWYLISGTSARIETSEIEFINWMIKQGLPVIVVLSKSYDKTESEVLRDEIKKLVPTLNAVVTVLAQATDQNSCFGLEELIEETFNLLPQGLRNSFVHSQEASLKLKRSEALKTVTMSMATTFGTGYTASNNSDAPIMMATQTLMMSKITSIYGVDINKQQVETALGSLLGVYGAITAGKSLSSHLAQLLPGVGKVGSGLITGGVGMIITGALGRAYIELMELVLKGKVNLSAITPDELTTILVNLLPKYLPKNKLKDSI